MQRGVHGRPSSGERLSSSDAEQTGSSRRLRQQDSQPSSRFDWAGGPARAGSMDRGKMEEHPVPPRVPRKIGSRHTEASIQQSALTSGGIAAAGGSRPGSRRTSGSGGNFPLNRSQSFDLASRNNYESDSNISEASEGGRRRRRREKKAAPNAPNQPAPRKGD